MNRTCQHLALEQVLSDHCDPALESEIQEHLDSCSECQQRLSEMAADPDTWKLASGSLSTIETSEFKDQTRRQLQESCEFIVPVAGNEPDGVAGPSANRRNDWTRLLDPPRHPEMLGLIDQFEIESKLGQGGMGIVLKGFDRELNRPVAIKILAPHLASNGTARKRFAREAQAAAAVVHPNVVPIYAVKQSVERPYIVMQLVPGQSLQSLVDNDGPLSAKNVVRVGMQIADGLAAAHAQGLIHRDVKPANVLTERDVTRVMITDFGLARAVDDAGMTQTGWLAGTLQYMSPEQVRGDDLDRRSDLFSLGSLMYFLATGREPFRAERPYGVIQSIVHDQPVCPTELQSDIPVVLANIINKLLQKDPQRRFQSATGLSETLKKYLTHLQQPHLVGPPAEFQKLPTTRTRSWLRPAIAGLLTAGLVIGGIWWAVSAKTASVQSRPPSGLGNPGNINTPLVPLDDIQFLTELQAADSDLQQLERAFEMGNGPTSPWPIGSMGDAPDPAINPSNLIPGPTGLVSPHLPPFLNLEMKSKGIRDDQ